MKVIRAWKYRIYPSKIQERELFDSLEQCKNLWNSLLDHTKTCYKETGRFPTRKQLYLLTKETSLFSQVSQNVADRLVKSLKGMISRRKAGKKAGFPRFKSIERVTSFTYPQFGFKLDKKLQLSKIGSLAIKKHRHIQGKIKTLTVKKTHSGKWFAVFTSELEKTKPGKSRKPAVGIDLGIETFAYLSDGKTVENPRHLKQAEQKLAESHRQLSRKKKGSRNRRKAKLNVAIAYEKLTNRRRDFLHKASRVLAGNYSLIAMEDLRVGNMSKGLLAKHVLDCSWAEFSSMLRYKAEEAGSEVILVNPAHTTQECSSCGLIRKKTLAERWHECSCGASMHRDFNAARNILARCWKAKLSDRQGAKLSGATSGIGGHQACGEETATHYKHNGQVSSLKQEAHGFSHG
ncbi:MAG: transposase [Candidatus Micrarchaeota archaeon]